MVMGAWAFQCRQVRKWQEREERGGDEEEGKGKGKKRREKDETERVDDTKFK